MLRCRLPVADDGVDIVCSSIGKDGHKKAKYMMANWNERDESSGVR